MVAGSGRRFGEGGDSPKCIEANPRERGSLRANWLSLDETAEAIAKRRLRRDV